MLQDEYEPGQHHANRKQINSLGLFEVKMCLDLPSFRNQSW